jgi:hypothetical protein
MTLLHPLRLHSITNPLPSAFATCVILTRHHEIIDYRTDYLHDLHDWDELSSTTNITTNIHRVEELVIGKGEYAKKPPHPRDTCCRRYFRAAIGLVRYDQPPFCFARCPFVLLPFAFCPLPSGTLDMDMDMDMDMDKSLA